MVKLQTAVCVLVLACLVAPATGSLLKQFLKMLMKDVLEQELQRKDLQDASKPVEDEAYHAAIEKRAKWKKNQKVKWFKGEICKNAFDEDYCRKYYRNNIDKAPNDDYAFEELDDSSMAHGCLLKTTKWVKGKKTKVMSVAFNKAKSNVPCGLEHNTSPHTGLKYKYCGCFTYEKTIQWYKEKQCNFPFAQSYCQKYADNKNRKLPMLTLGGTAMASNPPGCLITNKGSKAVEVAFNPNSGSTAQCGTGDYPYCVCFTKKKYVKA